MKGARSTVWGVIAALMPALAAGQITTLAEKISNTGGPTTFDQAASPLSGAQVVAAKGGSSASVKVSRIWSQGDPDPQGLLGFSAWSVTASSPLNKNADDTDVATLDGLSNAGSLELTISRFRAKGRSNAASANEICARLHDEARASGAAVALTPSNCTRDEVRTLGAAALHEFDSRTWEPNPNDSPWVWGASVKVGYQNFDFVDTASAAKGKQDETPWSLGAFFAYKPLDWHASITPSFKYQRAYKEGQNGVVCPAGTGGAVSCATGPLGSPKEVTKKLVALDLRKHFIKFGVGFTSTYDAEAKVWGFELPVHFVKDKDDNLIAGVKLGYRDDTEAFTGTVFVGTKFGLLK